MKIGIMGAGQLGRMLGLAGIPLGLTFRFLDPSPNAPASAVGEQIVGEYDDPHVLERFADDLSLITYEFENVPMESACRLQALGKLVLPPPIALETAQDRLIEKQFFRSQGIPTPPFRPVTSYEELREAVRTVGLPAVLKTRRFGYDGKGQVVLQTEAELVPAWEALEGSPLILEGYIPFQRELSLIAVRGLQGELAFYPLVENHHREGILRLTLAPAPNLSQSLQQEAEEYGRRVLTALNYVGVLAIEFFEKEGHLIANEMAPRVHNSGHWSIEGATTSQFENHLRAILGYPLGMTTPRGHSAMINLIGSWPSPETVLAFEGAHLHLYGKPPRPRRKVGHITLTAETIEGRDALVEEIRQQHIVDF
ncbi:5-(carboxyamino)imidazole ribonucleotide synthase [Chthonomonas calidirosea]|uniref:N5-carboxyaminoimidazole ribonucleotide synthase n=1 Tax=Chthonomonas calidirosea (strain DSM 23976 / ICMP 18418 / T49) TaxID=1303518 RepID=S0ES33_CHTCT|nr:5-(carboxyamino)imidazole ribonucleotide synthase [Chthonomonas calidirosea]CCW33891.1 5-(carboxyamino)imidazole ribonucleotide synthase [Chthonomonas calidirosea T49]CEK16359.1 5-(carboxyamino)imidazole ribonucleotide synthase [Chthonomonas calidirosea]